MKKRIGRYSKADFLKEISKVFKTLDRPFSRREYDEVANIHSRLVEKRFGSWNKALVEAGLAEKFKDFLDVEKEIKNFKPEDKIKEDWDLEKTKLLKQAEDKKVTWLREQAYKTEFLKEMLIETLAKAAPPVVEVHPIKVREPKSEKGRKHVTLWFDFSDLQLGTLIRSEDVGGLNAHNWIVFQEKLKVWKDQVIEKIAEYSEQSIIDHIIISCGGDMVEGVDIFKGQTWQVDRHVVDQAIFGAYDVAAAFIEIFLTYPYHRFFVIEVFGNHGRVGGRKGETPYSCSMDKVFQRMLELQIKATSKVTNCTWHHNEAWFYLLELYGWTHLVLHGDQGLGGLWSNRPTINSLEKGLARYSGMLQQQLNFVHVSHFHNDAQMTLNMSQVLINGSFVGTSDFSARTMVTSSPPVQVMHVFDPRCGLLRTERLYLTAGEVRVPIEPNTLKSR